jgi:NADPH2:quinone reductase
MSKKSVRAATTAIGIAVAGATATAARAETAATGPIAASVVASRVPRAKPRRNPLRTTRRSRKARGADATVRAIEISRYGAPEVLRETTRADPVAGAGEVLIRVTASGVNRPDVLQRKGAYAPPPGVSDLPGLEVAGPIVGGDLAGSSLKVGDRVCALVAGGGYAQLCVAPTVQTLPVPKGLSDIEAASLPETVFTVWQNVFHIAGLRSGEWLLVQGGSSGIGVTAIQLAQATGAKVIVTAGSDDKCAACVSLGADHAINYRTQDFVAEVKRITEGRGVSVVLDMVAGDYVARELQCLADDGRLAIIAVQGGVKSEIDSGLVLRRRLSITGSTLRARSVAYKGELARALREHVWPLIESGRFKPVIHKVFPASQAAEAHALMESGRHVGKIVLTW